MLEVIFGNNTAEKILFFILAYGDGYAKKMADIFNMSVNGIQQQLRRMENGGVLVGQLKGNTRLYTFNPRCLYLKELKTLISKAYEFLPEKEKDKYYRMRTRPRRAGKPL